MLFRKSCEHGHKPKAAATVHTGGGLRSICARCGAPLALKVGGWKSAPIADPAAGPPPGIADRRKGPRGTRFDRSTRS